MKIPTKTFVFAASLIFAATSWAEIVMPKIFGDNMMFQRQTPLQFWGKADANARVGIEFAGQKKMVKADAKGEWKMQLNALEANKTPQEVVIYENGKEGKRIKNVLVGEVWVLGGQSNMQWRAAQTTDIEKLKTRADYPLIRYFKQPTGAFLPEKQFDTQNPSGWEETTPDNVASFSAVGIYFAELLLKDIDVPVGLIDTPLGGSAMRAWIPEEEMDSIEFLQKAQSDFKKQLASYNYEESLAAWQKRSDEYNEKVKKAKAEGKPVPEKPWNVRTKPNALSPQRPQETPSWLYNAKIAPIVNFPVRGVLWYQGESDAGGKSCEAFVEQFERVISSWRKAWKNDDLYFAWVQLASFGTKTNWGDARWAQYQTMKNVSKTGMANIIDLGEEKDVHPRNKTDVALRLEKIILRDVYNVKGIRPYGPMFRQVKYTPRGAEVFFDTDGKKLIGKGEPRGFEVKIDGEWKKAKAEMLGKRIIVNTLPEDKGKEIVGVRYLWESWALPNVWLFSNDNLPALSFSDEKKSAEKPSK